MYSINKIAKIGLAIEALGNAQATASRREQRRVSAISISLGARVSPAIGGDSSLHDVEQGRARRKRLIK